jgi:hypothetical protein
VLAKTNLNQTGWVDLSGSITATRSNASWTNKDFNSLPQRFYRIASPQAVSRQRKSLTHNSFAGRRLLGQN